MLAHSSQPTYGLLGKSLQHSFSKTYFNQKFKQTKYQNEYYENFETDNPETFILNIALRLKGFNVTLPYKEAILPYLHAIDNEALSIGAVNTVKNCDGKLVGYNTDWWGFTESLKPYLKPYHTKALILGTGGAAKAIQFGLERLQILHQSVSTSNSHVLSYTHLTSELILTHQLIINTTPLGMYPHTSTMPQFPVEFLTPNHLVVDLIYNPEKTLFLKKAAEKGATTLNGMNMLYLQAEKSWEIWQE